MVLANWAKVDAVLGVSAEASSDIPSEILQLVEDRQAAREARDFGRSDEIRDELQAKGWAVKDTPQGPRLRQI